MVLTYFREESNFGDALNPMIFEALLPDIFVKDSDTDFFGIGSIIGMEDRLSAESRNKVIFSSGYGYYGKLPELTDRYHIVCVRGPMTAGLLKIDPKLAITDGAVLLKYFKFKELPKKYDHSYMPHWQSAQMFNWEKLCQQTGINYIDPLQDPQQIIRQILQTRVLITEAMHGAIVADTLRVPWIPVKAYAHIKEFKWMDWTASMELPYVPNKISPRFDNKSGITEHFNQLSKELLHPSLNSIAARGYLSYKKWTSDSSTERAFLKLRSERSYLSKACTLEDRGSRMLEKLETVKELSKRLN